MGRPSLLTRAALASALALSLLVFGCERDPAPPLLDVTEVQPHEVERGDRLEIRGRGFGEGHAAKLTFHGELHRPGQEPERATIEATGEATSRESIELVLSERIEALFCRDGDALAHTTFTGDLEVAFAPAMVGAPPIVATLHDVRLDLLPPVRERGTSDMTAKEGAHYLASVGLSVDQEPAAAGGLVVTEVANGSAAARSGINAGDRLTTLDQVSLDSLSDARPALASGAATLGVRASDADVDRQVTLDSGGLAFGTRGLVPTAVMLGLAAALLLLFIAPRSAIVAWIELRAARRLQRLGRSPDRTPAFRDARSFGSRLSPLVVLVPFLSLPFADAFGLDLDVGLLFVLLATALVLVTLFAVGARRRAFRDRMRLLAERLLDQLPAAFALGCVVLLTGSLRLREIVRAQGGMPWEWSVFRTPLVVVLIIAWLAAALRPDTRPKAPPIPEADMERRLSDRTNVQPSIGLREAHLAFLASVGAALFLGGWQLPGIAPHDEAHGTMLRLLGAALFLGKSAALYATADLAQSMVPYLDLRQRLRVALRVVLPLALLGFAVTLGWTLSGPTHAVERTVGLATFALLALMFLRSTARIIEASVRKTTPAHLDPFV